METIKARGVPLTCVFCTACTANSKGGKKMKKMYVGAVVAFIMVFSVLGAGCTLNTSTSTLGGASASPTSTQQHDAVLEAQVPAIKEALGQMVDNITGWDVTWNSPNSVTIVASTIDNGIQWSYRETDMKLNTTEEATAYLNANNGGYSLVSSTTSSNNPWVIAAGRYPTVYLDYGTESGSTSSGDKIYNDIFQFDNYISVVNQEQLSQGTPTASPSSLSTEAAFLQSQYTELGYVIMSNFTDTGKTYDGYPWYSGEMIKNGTQYDINIVQADSQTHAIQVMNFSISSLKNIGFTGDYSSSTNWDGTKNDASALVFVTDSNYVITIFGE